MSFEWVRCSGDGEISLASRKAAPRSRLTLFSTLVALSAFAAAPDRAHPTSDPRDDLAIGRVGETWFSDRIVSPLPGDDSHLQEGNRHELGVLSTAPDGRVLTPGAKIEVCRAAIDGTRAPVQTLLGFLRNGFHRFDAAPAIRG